MQREPLQPLKRARGGDKSSSTRDIDGGDADVPVQRQRLRMSENGSGSGASRGRSTSAGPNPNPDPEQSRIKGKEMEETVPRFVPLSFKNGKGTLGADTAALEYANGVIRELGGCGRDAPRVLDVARKIVTGSLLFGSASDTDQATVQQVWKVWADVSERVREIARHWQTIDQKLEDALATIPADPIISRLPDAILGRILGFLPQHERLRCSLVSKRWLATVRCPDLWQRVVLGRKSRLVVTLAEPESESEGPSDPSPPWIAALCSLSPVHLVVKPQWGFLYGKGWQLLRPVLHNLTCIVIEDVNALQLHPTLLRAIANECKFLQKAKLPDTSSKDDGRHVSTIMKNNPGLIDISLYVPDIPPAGFRAIAQHGVCRRLSLRGGSNYDIRNRSGLLADVFDACPIEELAVIQRARFVPVPTAGRESWTTMTPHLTHLTSLTIHAHQTPYFKAREVESLANLTALKELYIDAHLCAHRREFRGALKVIGPNLQKLSISGLELGASDLPEIAGACPNLVYLRFDPPVDQIFDQFEDGGGVPEAESLHERLSKLETLDMCYIQSVLMAVHNHRGIALWLNAVFGKCPALRQIGFVQIPSDRDRHEMDFVIGWLFSELSTLMPFCVNVLLRKLDIPQIHQHAIRGLQGLEADYTSSEDSYDSDLMFPGSMGMDY